MRRAIAFGLALGSLSFAVQASAAVVWEGDFEDDDLEEWSYVLNEENISIASDPVARGTHAARIELTNDATWPNGLKRVELQHQPAAGRTAEDAKVFFAWSFYLPQTLPTSPSAQIGYWETNASYKQMMAFEVKGEDITFSTRHPSNKVQWSGNGVVTPGMWHRLAMAVVWSQDAAKGKVDVWFDGQQVVTGAAAKTLFDANSTFVQIGLLRGAVEFADAPVIFVDDAVEGDSLEDVRAMPPAPDAGAPPGVDAGVVEPPAPAPSGPAAQVPSSSPSSASDGGCHVGGSGGLTWLAGALAVVVARRWRRRHQA